MIFKFVISRKKKMQAKPKKARHYVNNQDLYSAIVTHRELVSLAKSKGTPLPRISEYIGECVKLLCTRMGRRSNWGGYSYREEMVGDAIIDCLCAIEKFDPDKGKNPFGYLSRVAWRAFIRRLHKEKKESYIKHVNFINELSAGSMDAGEHETMKRHLDYSRDLVASYEKKITDGRAKRSGAAPPGVEAFVEVDTGPEPVYNDISERDE